MMKETLYTLFKKIVEEKGNATAIICDNQEITFCMLKNQVDYIADLLLRKEIINTPILIKMRKKSLTIAAMLAVIATGNYYIPTETQMPILREKYILDLCHIQIILTDDLSMSKENIDVILIDTDEVGINHTFEYEEMFDYKKIAYCIFTSGTTGIPKGILVSEYALLMFVKNLDLTIDFKDGKVFLCASAVSFDIFFVESIFAILKGFTVVMAQDNEASNPRRLIGLIKKYKIDILQMTPTRLQTLLLQKEYKYWADIKCILIGGEKFQEQQYEIISQNSNCNVYNVYGPTETTIWCSAKKINAEGEISIGKPFPNVKFLICDKNGEQVCEKVKGELYIGGEILSSGYVNAEELTKDKYCYIDGYRYYKSGDICELVDGEYYIYGRTDNQIKYHGYRIELEEIEKEAEKCPNIIRSIATPIKRNDETVGIRLYYKELVIEKESDKKLKSTLEKYLPEYMLPTEYISVTDFVCNTNGKIDRSYYNSSACCEHKMEKDVYMNDVAEGVKKLIIKEIGNKEIMGNTELNTVLDSLEFVKIIVDVEETYKIRFNDDEIVDRFITYKQFIGMICSHMKG